MRTYLRLKTSDRERLILAMRSRRGDGRPPPRILRSEWSFAQLCMRMLIHHSALLESWWREVHWQLWFQHGDYRWTRAILAQEHYGPDFHSLGTLDPRPWSLAPLPFVEEIPGTSNNWPATWDDIQNQVSIWLNTRFTNYVD